MTNRPSSCICVLAIAPVNRGFGFVVLEERKRLVDWGVAELYSANDKEFLVRIDRFIELYHPSLIVTEEVAPINRRRAFQAIATLREYAASRHITTASVTRSDIRMAFEDVGRTKHEIARAIAEDFPELQSRLPPIRKLWQTQSKRMAIFDALSFIYALPQARKRQRV